MAIDMIQEAFPAAEVSWERTPRVKPEMLTVSSVKGVRAELANVPQRDISDHYRGQGVDTIRQMLMAFKETVEGE